MDSSFQAVPTPSISASEPSPVPTTPSQVSAKRKVSRHDSALENNRKTRKVSRACDFCKVKKARCSGTLPCDVCVKKRLQCVYNARYARGRPPTPPPASEAGVIPVHTQRGHGSDATGLGNAQDVMIASSGDRRTFGDDNHLERERARSSRASPELDIEIEGQYFDNTSSLTFLHRAWKRLSTQRDRELPDFLNGAEKRQKLTSAGDAPVNTSFDAPLPNRDLAQDMFNFYFDTCIVTYRFMHRNSVQIWLDLMLSNVEQGTSLYHGLNSAKAAMIFTIFAIVTFRKARVMGRSDMTIDEETKYLQRSDPYLCTAAQLLENETGLPRLESAQARLIQVLYLLQTSRMNQAWYTFGHALQIISALGLHRRTKRGMRRIGTDSPNAVDYIISQCRRRTFWVAYTIDLYLGVVLGRPRHFHDEDIDQEWPECINDEDMMAEGPSTSESMEDCSLDALLYHAKLAQIIGEISREVYKIKPVLKRDRLAASQRLSQALRDWQASLPPHLGTLKPFTLMPNFRRQAIAMKLGYAHAMMHANRPFLMKPPGGSDEEISALGSSADECIAAAGTVLRTVDSMAADGTLYFSLWWTHYVTFCALAVVYVRQIQKATATSDSTHRSPSDEKLLALADRCQAHLAQTTTASSPSRRYTVVLEELRLEAGQHHQQSHTGESAEDAAFDLHMNGDYYSAHNILDQWQTTDWLDLDSSAFGPFGDFGSSPELWLPNIVRA